MIYGLQHRTVLAWNYSDGVAQSVKAPNSNCKVASSMPTLGITRCCILGKDTYHYITCLADQ